MADKYYMVEMFSNNSNTTASERITAASLAAAIMAALTLLAQVNVVPNIPHDFRIKSLVYVGDVPVA